MSGYMNPIFSSRGELPHLEAYFKQSVPKGCTPDFLCHYTKPDVLQFICKQHGRLLATNAAFFDDHSEIFYGAERFLDVLALDGEWSRSDTLEFKKRLSSLRNKPFLPWITSLSCRKDSSKMWHNYTIQDGGYCIVFRYEGLMEFVKWLMMRRSIPSDINTDCMFIMPCVYEGKHDIEGYIRAYNNDFKDVLSNRSNTNMVLAHLLIAGAFIKTSRYQFEHEWRMILIPAASRLITNDILILNNKPRLSLGFEKWLDDTRRLIAGILISPHGNHQKLRANAKKLVRDYIVQNNNLRPKIEISSLPTEYDKLITYWDKSQQAYELHT